MARTRQRSKQRKAKRLEQERKAQGSTGQKPPSTPAEEAAVQQAEAYELADVLEESGGDPDVASERLEDEVSGEVVKPVREERTERTAQERKPQERKPEERKRAERKRGSERKRDARPERKRDARQRGRVVSFLVSVWAELRRVQWPNRNQVTQATTVVLVFCLLAGAYLAFGDFVFSKLMKVVL